MNLQTALCEQDLVAVGADATMRLGSLASLMSVHMARMERREIKPSTTYSPCAESKNVSSSKTNITLNNSVIRPSREIRRFVNGNDSSSLPLDPPADTSRSCSYMLAASILPTLPHPASPASAAKHLSYEQETWRLYHRIQTARREWSSHHTHDDGVTQKSPAQDDLGCSSSHTSRFEDDFGQPIIFDLEL
ncbi:hypothetical protein MPSEU_001058900 [Mayamaea pseudoterrestris]|nr:hypothetical protein MPSEU_001058900 [Mayamaea pseudoterrestris]